MHEREIRGLPGLSRSEAAARLRAHGPNLIPEAGKRGILRIVLETFLEPMFLLLVACGVIYLLVGEPRDALLLLFFVLIMMAITIVQEGKTEKTLDALRNLSNPRAEVIRDGERFTVAGAELVPDDLVILSEGERVPADGVVLWSANLSIDESLLTGESVPVDKSAAETWEGSDAPMDRPGGEDSPFAYSGSLVVTGQGVFRVKETGKGTEMGRIGAALGSVAKESTPLQKETGKLVRTIFIVAAALCLGVVVVFGLTRGDWLDGLLAGITLAMAMLPEEFPVVLTVFLALGAWRISKKNVLARRMNAVESLGAATVLCSDKTGTITQNRMSIERLWTAGAGHDVAAGTKRPLPEQFHRLVEWGILASRKDPFDPMEKAFAALGTMEAIDERHIHPAWDVIREYPLSREFLSVTNVWKSDEDERLEVAAKGAPETVMDLCHMAEAEKELILAEIGAMAERGLRVLGVASGRYDPKQDLPAGQHDFDFEFLGLVGLADPIRPAVPGAVRLCREAGVRVVMITGDYPKTAANIAAQIGLERPGTVITGAELDRMGEDELRARVAECNVFARVVPEQKLLLVRALRGRGETVAMTGDGVNDAPALKAADIGVAMGQRGTDVAREASALVLLDDDFSSIVAAIRTGRRIFDNLRKAMAYIVSVHIPIAGMSILPVFLKWREVALFPVHIVFLELLIDPACSVVFEGEPEEKDIMSRPPRKREEPLFGARTMAISLVQGAVALAAVFLAWIGAEWLGYGPGGQRAISFVALVASNLGIILANRSWRKGMIASFKSRNPSVLVVLGAVSAFLALALAVPFLRELFRFDAVAIPAALAAAALGLASAALFDALKLVMRRAGKPLA